MKLILKRSRLAIKIPKAKELWFFEMKKNTHVKFKQKSEKLKTLSTINNARRKHPHCIYIDESGNTGSNLLDLDQPVFVLSSISLSDKNASELLKIIDCKSTSEVHFINLIRKKSGQDSVINLLKNPLINTRNVKISIYHKKYMICGKIIDLLVEPMEYKSGVDLYSNGANIDLSNILYYCIPAFCGELAFNEVLNSFVKMLFDKSDQNITKFYSELEFLRKNCFDKEMLSIIDLLMQTKIIINEALENIEKSSLDPAFPALFDICMHWGKEYSSGFHIYHDASIPLERQIDLLHKFRDAQHGQIPLGYDRKMLHLPLKYTNIEFIDSHTSAQLQVVDIISGAVRYWACGLINIKIEDYFLSELNKLNLDKYISGKIWPSPALIENDHEFISNGLNVMDQITRLVFNKLK